MTEAKVGKREARFVIINASDNKDYVSGLASKS